MKNPALGGTDLRIQFDGIAPAKLIAETSRSRTSVRLGNFSNGGSWLFRW